MAKIFQTSDDIVELAENVFDSTGLPQVGINLKVMSVTKSKDVLKVTKANATTEFLTNKKDMVTRRSLLRLVGKRRQVLDYLQKVDIERYRKLIKDLGLRR